MWDNIVAVFGIQPDFHLRLAQKKIWWIGSKEIIRMDFIVSTVELPTKLAISSHDNHRSPDWLAMFKLFFFPVTGGMHDSCLKQPLCSHPCEQPHARQASRRDILRHWCFFGWIPKWNVLKVHIRPKWLLSTKMVDFLFNSESGRMRLFCSSCFDRQEHLNVLICSTSSVVIPPTPP